jgi:UDP-N-acetylglucosamine acyltransferase
MPIHPAAVVDPKAEIHETASIGAYAIIGADVVIGADTVVDAHAVISGPAVIGRRNQIGSFASVGAPPQDMRYKGEPTELVIGDDNHIREYVSIHRGTAGGRGRTVIGSGGMIMASCHIAHDCILHDHVIMANMTMLAGHVEVGRHANLGGGVGVHQFCRIGAYAYIGGMSGISMDVPPYMILVGTRNQMRITGVNKIGLRRNGMSREAVEAIERAFRIIFRAAPEVVLQDALFQTEQELSDSPEVLALVDFFRTSKRGVVKRTEEE